MNFILAAGSLLGLLSIVMGVYFEYGLTATVSTEAYHLLEIAVKNNQLQAVLITTIGLALFAPLKELMATRIAKAAWVFVLSTLFFSGSIYLFVVTGFSFFAKLAPIGTGLSLIAWLMVVWAASTRKKDTENKKDYFYFRPPSK